MKALFAASELYPFVKTGGLGDVAAALPSEIAKQVVDIRLFVPGYKAILDNLSKKKIVRSWPSCPGAGRTQIIKGVLPNGLIAYAADIPDFFERNSPYVDDNGQDWPDNHYRFAAFCRLAATLHFYEPDWQPDVIHGNDWQSGLISAYLSWQGYPRPASIFTIHNIQYPGLFPRAVLAELGLPAASFQMEGLEYYGQVGFLKAGLYYADHITTVSPTYAREIQTEPYGAGLHGLLQARSHTLTGIINGVDLQSQNPATDPLIPIPFGRKNLGKKEENKYALLKEFKLEPSPGMPVFGVISRLTYEKGLDLLLDALPPLLEQGAILVAVGSGWKKLEDGFQKLAKDWPSQAGVHIGYDEELAHRIQAGADALIIPSRTEPCGLVQMHAQHYGALPVVRRTGGLADTVIDYADNPEEATGFIFDKPDAAALEGKLEQVCRVFQDRSIWRQIQENAMKKDFSWETSARKYCDIYRSAIHQDRGRAFLKSSTIT